MEVVPLLHGRNITLPDRMVAYGAIFLAVTTLLVASCSFSTPPSLPQSELDEGWPAESILWQPRTRLPPNWQEGKLLWSPESFPRLGVELPLVPDATPVGLDAQCVLCHETYVTAFTNNVHRKQGCENCHGPAGRHLGTRGEGVASILSLSRQDAATPSGRVTTPAERSEVCLRCHETDPIPLGPVWRHSVHAHQGIACSDCHQPHYNVPPGTPPTVVGSRQRDEGVELAQLLESDGSLKGTSNYLGAVTPGTCYRCHERMKRFEEANHPHQIGTPIHIPQHGTGASWDEQSEDQSKTFDCTTCHNPHGNVLKQTRKDLCLQCHEGPHLNEWHGSQHDLAGIGCTDCHNPHPETGPAMSVDQPGACYRCHSQKRPLEEIAGPHQIRGPNGFLCTTCHNPHGKVTASTRADTCLKCHTGAPTMAWHTSFHFREGVACADCHNPHPDSQVQQVTGIRHTSLQRPPRRPMSVDEPETCYKCHPQIYALSNMPSHHPIREGRMVCSDCHDGHGQGHGSLKAETLNQLCFQCHAEKEGPFVWEHAPVTESCANCHNPHGTVANNLLLQPTTFLCLRCHTGHSTHGGSPQCNRCHLVNGNFTDVGGGPRDPTIPTTPTTRQALFTDCTQCHSQIHGSDHASGFECGHGMRR